MINRLKYLLVRVLYRINLRIRLKTHLKNQPKNRIILLNVPSHGNLGDHLISLAEKQLIKDLTGKEPITFTTADLFYGIDLIEDIIKPNDILLITGGGYLGSIWPEEEVRVKKLVNDLPDNSIIIMPQTVYYDKDEMARRLMNDSKKVYQRHSKFFLTVRERNSLDVVYNNLNLKKSQVALLPDMALYLNFTNCKMHRNGIILCMRNDKEKGGNGDLFRVLNEYIKDKEVRCIDTQVNRSVKQSVEKQEVFNLIQKFQTAELVITDRLHGMLFSVICGTPVIAFDNYNHKVRGVYDCWLKNLNYVRFVDSSSSLADTIIELLNNGADKYNPEFFQHQLQSFLGDKLQG